MRLRHWLLLVHVATATVAVAVPPLANLTGSLWGMPSAIVWSVGWVTASFGGLLLFHLADGGEARR